MASFRHMDNKSSQRLLAAVLLAGSFALTGCATAFNAPIHSTPEVLAPGERLPLRVGVLLSQPTLGYQCHAHIPLGEWVYPFGKDLPSVVLQTFSQVFENVALVQAPDYSAYDLIVAPTFDEQATHVDISISTIRVSVAMNFAVSDARGVKWQKGFTGELTTPGNTESFNAHGQAVSKAVAAAAVAMRSELAALRPRAEAAGTAPAEAAWWAK
jgi:hypothetical protein